MKAIEIYFDMELTLLDEQKRFYVSLMRTPMCGCIIEGFKEKTPEMKLKTINLHYAVCDHNALLQCTNCDLVTYGHHLPIHKHFHCEDQVARRTFELNPTFEVFKELRPI